MHLRRFVCVVLALAIGGALSACASTLRPVDRDIALAGQVDVRFRYSEGDILSFEVVNRSSRPMKVCRDNLRLLEKDGFHPRIAGGVKHTYVIQPGEHHELNASFDVDEFHAGDEVLVTFDDVIVVDEKSLALPPFRFRVK